MFIHLWIKCKGNCQSAQSNEFSGAWRMSYIVTDIINTSARKLKYSTATHMTGFINCGLSKSRISPSIVWLIQKRGTKKKAVEEG